MNRACVRPTAQARGIRRAVSVNGAEDRIVRPSRKGRTSWITGLSQPAFKAVALAHVIRVADLRTNSTKSAIRREVACWRSRPRLIVDVLSVDLAEARPNAIPTSSGIRGTCTPSGLQTAQRGAVLASGHAVLRVRGLAGDLAIALLGGQRFPDPRLNTNVQGRTRLGKPALVVRGDFLEARRSWHRGRPFRAVDLARGQRLVDPPPGMFCTERLDARHLAALTRHAEAQARRSSRIDLGVEPAAGLASRQPHISGLEVEQPTTGCWQFLPSRR